MIDDKFKKSPEDQAIVIGGSLMGMQTAQVLSKYFKQVLILDQEVRSAKHETARFVPQGDHSHFLHHHGGNLINHTFPGFFDEMEKHSCFKLEPQKMAWNLFGNWNSAAPQMKEKLTTHSSSRPLIDYVCRNLLAKNNKVTLREGYRVSELIYDKEKDAVTGVRVHPMGEPNQEEQLHARLIVDTTGVSSRAPQWLKQMGYEQPKEVGLPVDIAYTSRLFKRGQARPKGNWDAVLIWPPSFVTKKGGLLFPIEDGLWHCSLVSQCGPYCPTDEKGFLEFAKALDAPHIYEIISNSEPATDITRFHLPKTQRRLYEKLSRFPEGFLVLGDAWVRLNPVYGQGMVVGSLHVRDLDFCMKEYYQPSGSTKGMATKFFKRASTYVDDLWLLTCSEDYRHKELLNSPTAGIPMPLVKALNPYTLTLFQLVTCDPDVSSRFFKVLSALERPPHMLVHPSVVFKALLKTFGIKKIKSIVPYEAKAPSSSTVAA